MKQAVNNWNDADIKYDRRGQTATLSPVGLSGNAVYLTVVRGFENSWVVLMLSRHIIGRARVQPEGSSPVRSVRGFQARLVLCGLGGLLFVLGCDTPASAPLADVERVGQEGTCVVQVRSDYVEIHALDGTSREYRIPDIRKTASLFQGRLAPDGSFAAGSAETGFVGVKLDGGVVWREVDVSFSGRPAISTDTKRVAFTAPDGRLVTFDVATAGLKELGVRGKNPAWSFTGDRLAYDDGMEVRVYEFVRGTSSVVGRGTEPSWSPDGTSLAVRVNSERVDLVNLQTQERRILIDASKSISVPLWSPNGQWLMYTRRGPRRWWSRAGWTGSEPSQILIRQVRTGAETSIGEFYKANPGDYTWVTNRELCRATSPAE
jgi:hypothetical protein